MRFSVKILSVLMVFSLPVAAVSALKNNVTIEEIEQKKVKRKYSCPSRQCSLREKIRRFVVKRQKVIYFTIAAAVVITATILYFYTKENKNNSYQEKKQSVQPLPTEEGQAASSQVKGESATSHPREGGQAALLITFINNLVTSGIGADILLQNGERVPIKEHLQNHIKSLPPSFEASASSNSTTTYETKTTIPSFYTERERLVQCLEVMYDDSVAISPQVRLQVLQAFPECSTIPPTPKF
jgi:hypothetical protein